MSKKVEFAIARAPNQKIVITLDAQSCRKRVEFASGMAPNQKSVVSNLAIEFAKDAAT